MTTNKKASVAALIAAFSIEDSQALGHRIALTAADAHLKNESVWSECRTYLVAAIGAGKGQEYVDAFREGGSKVKGKKAPWYRTYLCIMQGAVQHGVKVTDDMGAKAAQVAVQDAKRDARPVSEAQAQALIMFERAAQGCLNQGITMATLAKTLKPLKSNA